MLLTEWNLDTALAVREEEGVEKGRMDTARKLLALGVDVNTISQATELPIDTILKL